MEKRPSEKRVSEKVSYINRFCQFHKVLENPDTIPVGIGERSRLTAFEILSIDIADVDVETLALVTDRRHYG